MISRPAIALGLAAALAVLVPTVVLWPGRAPDVPLQPAPTRFRLRAVPAITPALDAPLFASDRKPPAVPPPVPVDTAPPPPPLPDPVLVGVVGRPGGGGVALVRKNDGTTTTVPTGGEVDGWRLLDIGNGTATFTAGDRQVRVTLDFRNRPFSGAAPAASPGDLPAPAATSSPASPAAPDTPSLTTPNAASVLARPSVERPRNTP